MRKAKATTGTAKKVLSPPVRKRSATAAKPRARHAPVVRRRKTAAAPASGPAPEAALARAQADVVAAKFQGDAAAPRPRPTLPLTYGESHLLLLPRDPQTLFATWDLAPALIESLKSRLGARGFAVSTLTLRLTPAGGPPAVFHVGRKARSRYLKVAGGSSFTAEIGFTTPTGRFELAARSVPCFLPLGPARSAFIAHPAPAVASYRAAPVAAKAVAASAPDAAAPASAPAAGVSAGSVMSDSRGAAVVPFRAPATPRTLGGASDLYRR